MADSLLPAAQTATLNYGTLKRTDASGRGTEQQDEATQGNGGKAYMYKMFRGPATIVGIRNDRCNRKGFEGPQDSLERGTPGFIPNAAAGRDVPITSWKHAIDEALASYKLAFDDLPSDVELAIREREAFTLVEGVDPIDTFKGRIDADDLVHKLLRHDQSTLAVQQLRLYAVHNRRQLNNGEPLTLESIPPQPGFDEPIIHEIPEELLDDRGRPISTTLSGQRPPGRLVLYTSRDNMHRAYRELRPRWKITYKTPFQMVGSKSIGELVPTTPGAQFVYASLELSALEPDYVALGRVRPNDGPLMTAIDRFAAEKIRELSKQIAERRRHDLSNEQLDEVFEENRRLNEFKNRFLPNSVGGESGPDPGRRGSGRHGGDTGGAGSVVQCGEIPEGGEI